MKKNSVIIAIYSVVYFAYILFMHLIDSVKGSNYWIGFAFMTLAFILTVLFAIFANDRKSFIFPMDISIIVISNLYLIATIAINTKYGGAIKVGKEINNLVLTRQFLIYEFACLLGFVVLFTVIGLNKKHTLNSNAKIRKEINDRRDLIAEISVLVEKVNAFGNHKDLIKKLEKLVDDIRFCNTDSDLDDGVLNAKIYGNIEKLEKEINNIIEIDTTDYSSIDDILFNIKEQLIKKERRAEK